MFQPPRYLLIANPFSLFFSRPFIKSLFPENLQADKKGRPTTAGSKIKVCSIWGNLWIPVRGRIFWDSGTIALGQAKVSEIQQIGYRRWPEVMLLLEKGLQDTSGFELAALKPPRDIKCHSSLVSR